MEPCDRILLPSLVGGTNRIDPISPAGPGFEEVLLGFSDVSLLS